MKRHLFDDSWFQCVRLLCYKCGLDWTSKLHRRLR